MNRGYLIGGGAVLVAASLLVACETGSVVNRVAGRITTPDGGKAYVVATEKTAFYRYGPQQGNGPDNELPKDTVVNLIRNSFGYSKVQIASSGEQGFVASEDIMPAPAKLLAALNTPKPDPVAATAGSSSEEHLDVRSTDPSFVPPPETLPPPDLPAANAEPTP